MRALVVALAVAVGGVVTAGSVAGVVGAEVLGWGEPTVARPAQAAPRAPGDAVTAPSPSASAVLPPTPPTTAAATPSATPTRSAAPEPAPAPSPSSTPRAAVAGLVAVVSVVDGDTIKVRVGGVTERVRVIGIDTPELRGGECYAQQAASRMQGLVQSRSVRLTRDRTQDDRDRYGRLLRHVQLADGRQVARLLIVDGYGEEYTHDRAYAGQADYRAAERAARAAARGLWGSRCAAPVPVAPSRCVIKGNIASDGERIHHLPGQQYYDVTRIDESKGERWFCSESDAVDAGWRRSRR